jgi:hypothetical protein
MRGLNTNTNTNNTNMLRSVFGQKLTGFEKSGDKLKAVSRVPYRSTLSTYCSEEISFLFNIPVYLLLLI